MKKVILASASPRRSELLRQIGIDFEVIPSNIEENIEQGMSPESIVQDLAYDKALSVAKGLKGASIVIGADTIVVKDGILGKPVNEEEAFAMLKSLQGGWHEVITGVALISPLENRYLKGYEKTNVKMRSLNDREIMSYIKTGEPMDKAGAYGIQGMGALLVERIDGCYFNVVGLPLQKLSAMFEEFGIFALNREN